MSEIDDAVDDILSQIKNHKNATTEIEKAPEGHGPKVQFFNKKKQKVFKMKTFWMPSHFQSYCLRTL